MPEALRKGQASMWVSFQPQEAAPEQDVMRVQMRMRSGRCSSRMVSMT